MTQHAKKGPIPAWIWHPERAGRRTLVMRKRFELKHPTDNAAFHFACTGSAELELDRRVIGVWPEHPRMTNTFFRAESFPAQLEPGIHTLALRIECASPMPIEPINIHLRDRSVGFIAFLSGDGLWIPTDATWEAEDATAEVICVLGEEPYGELDRAPDWFVEGGYGDIEVSPLAEFEILGVNNLQAEKRSASLILQGTAAGPLRFAESAARDELHLFYHLLKQHEWKDHRSQQKAMDLTGCPSVLIGLDRESNVRVRAVNRGGGETTLWWNGAESLEELERYEACITEELAMLPGQSAAAAPQGLKYVRLFVGAEEGEPFNLEIEIETAGVPIRQIGAFDSDVPRMNEIHETAVHTSRVCHQTGLWDGIKRDRLNWGYDVFMAAKADYSLWDDLEVLRRSIRELGRTPYGYWMNALPSYTLWWLCGMWDYYLETADRAFVLEMKEEIRKHIRWVQENTDAETGYFLPRARDELSFIEWSPMEARESWHSLNAIFYMAKLQMKRLARYVPELEIEWDDDRPAIEEAAFLEGSPSLLTTLLGIMSGYVSPANASKFLASYELKDPVTPLSAYWLAECCSDYGLHERAWDIIRTVWGTMLDADASTFWEGVVLSAGSDFHDALTTYTAYGSYRMSLCHSWASTPVVWMNKRVLGIRPLEPGYAEYAFEPQAVGGMKRCSGVVNSPRGPIRAEWKMEGGALVKSVRIGTEEKAGGRR